VAGLWSDRVDAYKVYVGLPLGDEQPELTMIWAMAAATSGLLALL
jgi:hypothetical protein